MPENISSIFFTYLGLLLGTVMGFIFYFLKIWSHTIIDFVVLQIVAGFIFLFFQMILGVILNKPKTSSNFLIGFLIIPLIYFFVDVLFATMSQQIVNAQEKLNLFINWMVLQVLLCYPFVILSQSVQFFTGYDVDKLEEIQRFGYVVSLSENVNSSKLKEILEDRLSIASLRKNLKISVIDDGKNEFKLCFFLYDIRNETVIKFGEDEKLIDFKAQVEGLLTDWEKRHLINSYKETSERPDISELYSIFGHRKLKYLSIQEIKKGISSFPKEHPSLFVLTVAIISALLSALFTRMFT